MDKIRIGIIGTADVAFGRFLPALVQHPEFEYVGVASRTREKTQRFIETFGGDGYGSYDTLLQDKSVDAVYIPLPPSLHYEWGMKALESGKHVFLEKPFATTYEETATLINLAKKKELAVHENAMFLYHNQLMKIHSILSQGSIGDIRLIRTAFGFPFRGNGDFRYDKNLGGGALLDCGYYPIKIASVLLGDSARVSTSKLNQSKTFDIEINGSATLENANGTVAQIAFGIDNSYKCELEIWGSKGSILANRIFTAPPTLRPEIMVTIHDKTTVLHCDEDNQFLKSISVFSEKIKDINKSRMDFNTMILQSKLIDSIKIDEKAI